jgi:hypothetical protein
MADNTVHTARDQLMPWLNGDQSAESPAKHKYRPDPQRAARAEEENAKPANRVPVERPDLVSIRVGGQICDQQSDQTEGDKDLAIAAILALARAQISASEERGASQETGDNRKGDPGRMGEEGGKAAPAENREPEKGNRPSYRDERQPWSDRHGRVCLLAR